MAFYYPSNPAATFVQKRLYQMTASANIRPEGLPTTGWLFQSLATTFEDIRRKQQDNVRFFDAASNIKSGNVSVVFGQAIFSKKVTVSGRLYSMKRLGF